MRVTVTFPLKNNLRVEPSWPIRLGDRSLSLKCEEGFLKNVSIIFHGVSVLLAPKIVQDPTKAISTSINFIDGYRLKAERDIRAWQALLAPWSIVDIDFDTTTLDYSAEDQSEEKYIQISNFKTTRGQPIPRGNDEFAIYGRAFLAIESGYAAIDRVAFFIDGNRALEAKRPIDAYNSFYLFFEANYNLPFKTKDATSALCGNSVFMDALRQAIAEPVWKSRAEKMELKSLDLTTVDEAALVADLVGLRGRLRHNTLSNPNRWDPNKQQSYELEARFLGAIALAILLPEFGKTFQTTYADEFVRQAEELHCMIEVHAILTIKENDVIQEVGLDLTFPTRTPSATLAKSVLQKVLEVFDEKSPGADLFAVRARIKPNGHELFRYDLGPSLPR
jgi:hypothetical protein